MGIYTLIEKKKKAQKRKEKIKLVKTVTTATTTGVLLGAAAGMLLTPKSGKENREDIKAKASDISDKVKVKTIEIKDNFDDKICSGKENFQEAKSKIKTYLDDKKNKNSNTDICDDVENSVMDTEVEEPSLEDK